MSEFTKEYKISYDRFDNKTMLRIRDTKYESANIFGRSKSVDTIGINLDILNYCVVDYVNSLEKYSANNSNQSDLRVMVAVSYYTNKSYNVELVKYDEIRSFIDSIKRSDNLVVGETVKTVIIGVLDSNIPINLITNVKFDTININNQLCRSIEDYYRNEESITCRFS